MALLLRGLRCARASPALRILLVQRPLHRVGAGIRMISTSRVVFTDNDTKKHFELKDGAASAPQPDPAAPKKRLSIKELIHKYGRSSLVVYGSLSTSTFALCYTAVGLGLHVEKIIEMIGLEVSPSAGHVIVAYALYKLTLPIRLAITAGVTPVVAPKLKARFPQFF